jgi:hypothetical protein
MPVNFDILQPANIGANFMAGRKEAQDMETGRLQQQEARLKLDDFQRKQAGLDQFLSEAEKRGQTGDPVDVASSYYKYAMTQRSPELITQATTLLQTAQQRKKFNELQNPNQLAGVARPAAPIAGALGSGTFDPYAAAAPTNALAPSAAPSAMTPTNALAPRAAAPAAPTQADRISEIRNRLLKLSEFPDVPQAKAEATMLLEEYKQLNTPHVVGGSLVTGAGKSLFTAPAGPTDIAKLIKERDALPLGDPNRAIYDKEIADRGAANLNAQQRLAFDKQKFAWEKSNPGYELKEDANGGYVAINKRTLEAVPVMVGGAAAPVAGVAAPAVNIPQMIDPKQSSKKEPIDSTDIKKYADKFFKGNIQSAIEDLKKQGWIEKPADVAAPAIVGPRTQLMGKTPALTESQGNATAFGMRMSEAHSLLKNLESKGETGTGVIGGTVGGVAGLVPLIGDKLTAGVDNIFNVLPGVLGGYSQEQQQVLNGRINFITAVLRKESGATIQPSEFATAERLYFPKPGYSDVVIKQKQKARELAIQAMKIQAGPGAKNIGANAPVGSNPNDPLNLGVR